MMSFGLSERVLRNIQTVFEMHPKVECAMLFGSRAKGNFKPGSDLDIAVEASNFSYQDLQRLRAALYNLDLLYTIDLLHIPSITEPALLDHIRRVGIPIFIRGDSTAEDA